MNTTQKPWSLDSVIPCKNGGLLALGEILVDMIGIPDTMPPQYEMYFGGSPANIVLNLARLGSKAKLAASLGKDAAGNFLKEKLKQENIDTTLLQNSGKPTSMVMLNRSAGTPLPAFYRGADFDFTWNGAIETALQDAAILHISSWPLSRVQSREVVFHAVSIARQNNVLIGFDPNYHPALWEAGEDGIAVLREMIGKADIVKPSEDDAERIFGAASPETQAQRFLALGAKLVMLTRGKDGVLLATASQPMMHLPSVANDVLDTTGAGDAFWSGFYAAILLGETVVQAAKLGSAVSAYKLGFVGACAPLLPLSQLRRKYGV